MRILVDITHPAHVHFFRNAIGIWRGRGHEVAITTREKDIAVELLNAYGEEYLDLGPARRGLFGLAREMVARNVALDRYVRRFRPNVMAAIGGVNIAHVGAFRRIPSMVFTDTENAVLSNRITFPFATRVVTPECYQGRVPSRRNIRYHGYHELAYLHPRYFSPDASVLAQYGLSPTEPFVFLRLVGWGAAHDFHDSGLTNLEEAVGELSRHARVVISSERKLPATLEEMRIATRLECIHHLLSFAELVGGESATMASEAACLGTPAIFVSTSRRGYTDEQESKYGLVYNFSDPKMRQSDALQLAMSLLENGANRDCSERRERLLNDTIDVTEFIVDTVETHARGR